LPLLFRNKVFRNIQLPPAFAGGLKKLKTNWL
jgi:hypothetical protein